MPSWPAATNSFTFSFTAARACRELPAQVSPSESANAAAFSGEASSTFVTSTQSSADSW
jgi:hypothetical protein